MPYTEFVRKPAVEQEKHDLGTTSVDRVPQCFSHQNTMINMFQVQKWAILEKDFSIPGGELGPTLKLKRPIVCKMYKDKIDTFYDV